jgi:hypothetical protein
LALTIGGTAYATTAITGKAISAYACEKSGVLGKLTTGTQKCAKGYTLVEIGARGATGPRGPAAPTPTAVPTTQPVATAGRAGLGVEIVLGEGTTTEITSGNQTGTFLAAAEAQCPDSAPYVLGGGISGNYTGTLEASNPEGALGAPLDYGTEPEDGHGEWYVAVDTPSSGEVVTAYAICAK